MRQLASESSPPTWRGGHRWAERLYGALSVQQHLVGAALLRIALALVLLYDLLSQWEQRQLLWGPQGVFPLWLFRRLEPTWQAPTLFAASTETELTAVYALAILACLLYLLGWQTRWAGLLFYICVWSQFMRNPFALNGGDSLVLVEMPFVLLMNTGAYLSADSKWRRPGQTVPAPHPVVALVHNVAVLCVLIQLCIVYLMSGVFKALGPLWRDGTAVYYSMRSEQFRLPGLGPLVYNNPVMVRAATHGTVLLELAYPFLIWSRPTRWLAVSAAVLFHVGVALFVSLVLFSAEMLCFQLLVFGDESYQVAYNRLKAPARGAGLLRRHVPQIGTRSA